MQESEKENISHDSGNEKAPLLSAINFLLTEVFYPPHSHQSQPEEMKGDSILAKSLNYLFIEDDINNF